MSSVGRAAGDERLAPGFLNWILGIAVVYATLFALGEVLFGYWPQATALGAVALVSAGLLARRLH